MDSIVKTIKNDPKDRLQIELGDSKQPSIFYPQVKIMRWDNEVNASFRLQDAELTGLNPVIEGDKVQLVGTTKEVHFYDIAPCEEHPKGGFEFEVILKEKPPTNRIEFTLVDKDVEYFYQPKLTQKEIDDGCARPENVVGSYAVYAKSNKINYVGGKEYKCGKVGHIFRPKIVDSGGVEVWGELHIEGGILSVTIPQEFLDKAVYPVRHAAGLLFGYNEQGLSGSFGIGDTVVGTKFTCPASVTGLSMTAYLTDGYYTGVFLLYLDSDNSKVAKTEEFSVPASGDDWYSADFISNPSLSNVDYWLIAFGSQFASGMVYDAEAGYNSKYDTGHDYPTEPETLPTGTAQSNRRYSIYCTYEAAAPGGPAGVKTVEDLAIASVKTINDTPIASVKTINDAS